MRMSDWGSDGCSSDLAPSAPFEPVAPDYRDHGSYSGGDDEPPGFMAVPHFDPEEHSSYSGQFEAAESPAGRQSGMARPGRSEERSVGQEWVSTCSFRWSPEH